MKCNAFTIYKNKVTTIFDYLLLTINSGVALKMQNVHFRWNPFLRLCAYVARLLSKKCRNSGKSLATLCRILTGLEIESGPPAPVAVSETIRTITD